MEEQSEPIGCLGVLFSLFGIRLQRVPAANRLPYRAQACLLSPAERSFYGVLQKAVGERAVVFAKVRVGDLLYVPRSKGMMAHLNRINSKHVDFVLCVPESLTPLAAIELDDASHGRPDRIDRDDFLNAAFAASGLPLLRFPARRQYELSDIVSKIAPILDAPVPIGVATSVERSDKPPTCPKCDSPMVLRTASNGSNKGEPFYGCSNYPRCREIVPVQ